MRFEWDDAKRRSNLLKHGFDFVGIAEVFEGDTVTILDDRFDYGEKRFITLGTLYYTRIAPGARSSHCAYGNGGNDPNHFREKGNQE